MVLYDLLCLLALLAGLFFLFVGALGTYRLPDAYNRMHAASKCLTLGVSGVVIAAGFYLASLPDANVLAVFTEVTVVLIFQFIAGPVGSHILAKGAHLAGVRGCKETIGDELAEDRAASNGKRS